MDFDIDEHTAKYIRRLRVARVWLRISRQHADDPLGVSCIHAVAEEAEEDPKFTKRWCTRFALEGTVAGLEDLPRSGRPRVADRAEVAQLLLDPRERSSLRSASERSEQQIGVHVSPSTVARAAHEENLHRHALRTGIELSPDEKHERQGFAKTMLRHAWGSTLMLDSTMITMHPGSAPETARWGEVGEVLTTDAGIRSPKAHVYAAASPHGMTQLHFATGTSGLSSPYMVHKGRHAGEHASGVGKDEFQVVLAALIAEGKEQMPAHAQSNMTVLMDRAAAHTSRDVATFMDSNGFKDFLLPTKSADMNWMDWALWHMLQQRVWSKHSVYGDSFTEFTKVVHQQWYEMSEEQVYLPLGQRQYERIERIARDGELIH